jgi:hypothetical protein
MYLLTGPLRLRQTTGLSSSITFALSPARRAGISSMASMAWSNCLSESLESGFVCSPRSTGSRAFLASFVGPAADKLSALSHRPRDGTVVSSPNCTAWDEPFKRGEERHD